MAWQIRHDLSNCSQSTVTYSIDWNKWNFLFSAVTFAWHELWQWSLWGINIAQRLRPWTAARERTSKTENADDLSSEISKCISRSTIRAFFGRDIYTHTTRACVRRGLHNQAHTHASMSCVRERGLCAHRARGVTSCVWMRAHGSRVTARALCYSDRCGQSPCSRQSESWLYIFSGCCYTLVRIGLYKTRRETPHVCTTTDGRTDTYNHHIHDTLVICASRGYRRDLLMDIAKNVGQLMMI